MADDCRCSVDALIADSSIRRSIDIRKYVSGKVGMPTLTDIMAELDRPGRDPRQTASTFKFDDSIHSFDDLKIGMQLDGIVTNITQKVCVSIPVRFGVTMDSDDPTIACADGSCTRCGD